MKVVLFFVTVLALCSIALSAVALVGKPPPGVPGHCWTESTGPMKNGEEKTIENSCSKASCHSDRTMSIVSCGVATVNGVRLTKYDLSKPYPQCCPGVH